MDEFILNKRPTSDRVADEMHTILFAFANNILWIFQYHVFRTVMHCGTSSHKATPQS
jgi:hypothetical protein